MTWEEPDWAGMFDRRCPARFIKRWHIEDGARCDLKRGHNRSEHMCERGLEVFVFRYETDVQLTPLGESVVSRALWRREREA